MKRQAFTIIEVAVAIFLAGLIGAVGYFYLNISYLKHSQYKTTLQSQINHIEAMVFQCKNLSEQMPNQSGGADALNTPLETLECNTSTPYSFDGSRYSFVPIPPAGFTPYTATESGSDFFITTTTENNTTQDEALKSLIPLFTPTQANLNHNATHATFSFYLSR